jgi:hypothetical protein
LSFEHDLKPAVEAFYSDEEASESGAAEQPLKSDRFPVLAGNSEEREEYYRVTLEEQMAAESKKWLFQCLEHQRTQMRLQQAAQETDSDSPQKEAQFSVKSITYDVAVNYALRTALSHVEQSQNLEAAMIFTTVILDTIQLVGDQLEVSTFIPDITSFSHVYACSLPCYVETKLWSSIAEADNS